jgi:hypothetical protein
MPFSCLILFESGRGSGQIDSGASGRTSHRALEDPSANVLVGCGDECGIDAVRFGLLVGTEWESACERAIERLLPRGISGERLSSRQDDEKLPTFELLTRNPG